MDGLQVMLNRLAFLEMENRHLRLKNKQIYALTPEGAAIQHKRNFDKQIKELQNNVKGT